MGLINIVFNTQVDPGRRHTFIALFFIRLTNFKQTEGQKVDLNDWVGLLILSWGAGSEFKESQGQTGWW